MSETAAPEWPGWMGAPIETAGPVREPGPGCSKQTTLLQIVSALAEGRADDAEIVGAVVGLIRAGVVHEVSSGRRLVVDGAAFPPRSSELLVPPGGGPAPRTQPNV